MTMRERLMKLAPYRDRIIITVIALVIGILLLNIGFWKTLLLIIITAIGYVIGTWRDGKLPQLIQSSTSFLDKR